MGGDGEGEGAVPAEPDDEFLRGQDAGARRFPDEPSADGGGGEQVRAEGGEGEFTGWVREKECYYAN